MSILQELDFQLGNNIQLLRDKLDLLCRQKDPETLRALEDITHAWETVAVLMAVEDRAHQHQLRFTPTQDGDSVVDSLFESAMQWYPHAPACKRKG